MRIPRSRTADIAQSMLRNLTEAELIETEAPREVAADLCSVLEQYSDAEKDITERARDLAASRGGDVNRIKGQLAREAGIQVGEEGMDYVLEQLIEMLMHSPNVEEVFGEDHVLRKLLRRPLREISEKEAGLDDDVRAQMKHVKEGSALWEVEYQRIREEVRRRRGLD